MASFLQGIKNTVAENVGGPSLALPEHQFELKHVPDLKDKVAVITGGSMGIGFGCTHALLSHNIAKIFLITRSEETMSKSRDDIKTDLGQAAADKVEWMQCDMGDWTHVVSTAEKIKEKTDRIDILINDAARGIMTYQLTEHGVDRHMAVNHMGHVILTSHLLPVLKKTAEKGNTVRIVTLGSNDHQGAPSDCKFESLEELNQDLGPNGQYGRSKLAQMLYAKYLNAHLTSKYKGILANSVHPGFVETNQSVKDIHEPYPVLGSVGSVGVNPLKKDQFMGCVSAMFAATKTEKSGQYICPPAIPESGSSQAQSDELAENLMTLTKKVILEKTYNESVGKGCPMEFY